MHIELLISLLAAAVVAGTPLLLVALGELVAERSGVLNLGVEGVMLIGAVTGFGIGLTTNSAWLGVGAAVVVSALVALAHAFVTVSLHADQVVSGLALTIFGTGLSAYMGTSFVGQALPVAFKPVALPVLSQIPYLGPIFFNQSVFVYLGYIIAVVIWVFLELTRPGLHLKAVGDSPATADSLGIRVVRTRYLAVCFGGMMAGLGGAFVSMAYVSFWSENLTAGRGWIALALVIFSSWKPLRVLQGAYLFGTLDALAFRAQALGINFSSYLLRTVPYVVTILVLVLTYNKLRSGAAPAALTLHFDREER